MKQKEEKEGDESREKASSVFLLEIDFLSAALVIVLFLFAVSSASAAEYHVHEGESIQAVINIANPGDTITAHNGTYTENVVVNKSNLTIRSANGSSVTIVQSNRTDRHVFNITDQNNVTLEGFTIRDASAAPSMTKGLIAMSLSALVLPPEYQVGKIEVTSVPSGATIGLDGVWYRMGTPNVIENVEPGPHTVSLRLNGYQDWSKRVRVKAGETRAVHATLAAIPTTGAISVTSVPSGATIGLDGVWYRIVTPNVIENVEPGYPTVSLRLNGYLDWSKRVHVKAGETNYVHAILTPTTGSIRITSTPSGANIYVDTYLGWSYKGKTPNTITRVSPDYYTIKLSLTGYQDWTKKVHVAAGETAQIHGTMIKATGSIYVTSKPSDAKVYLDNKYNGKTPYTITGVSPAHHAIKLTLVDYQDWSTNLQVKAGETTPVHATMIPKPTPTPTTGAISVQSSPSGATIYLEGFVGSHVTTPYTFTMVPPGRHKLELSLDGYYDWTTHVDVWAGKTADVYKTLTPIPTTGAILVKSEPPGANIGLDGVPINALTPYTITNVASGTHILELTLKGYLDWSAKVQVVPGKTAEVDAPLIPRPIRAGIYMNNASNCVIISNRIMNITTTVNYSAVGIAIYNSSGNAIQNGAILNCGHGIMIASGSDNRIERNIIRDNTIAGTGVRIERSATNTGIHENCFIDNVPQAWDDGTDNNWIGNYWSPPPGGPSNYIIPGAAGSEDKDPLDECILTGQPT